MQSSATFFNGLLKLDRHQAQPGRLLDPAAGGDKAAVQIALEGFEQIQGENPVADKPRMIRVTEKALGLIAPL